MKKSYYYNFNGYTHEVNAITINKLKEVNIEELSEIIPNNVAKNLKEFLNELK